MTVKDIKYSYLDSKYQLGRFVEFEAELEVPSFDYDDIVDALKKKYPKFCDIKVMSFKRN